MFIIKYINEDTKVENPLYKINSFTSYKLLELILTKNFTSYK